MSFAWNTNAIASVNAVFGTPFSSQWSILFKENVC
jgi:hypothetical protein